MRPDVVIAGAGLIGMACALHLQHRGLRVTVVERGKAGQEASSAAAGMLAAHDPANPAALLPLSELSLLLYPAFLRQVEEMSDAQVPLETRWTLEAHGVACTTPVPLELPHSAFRQVQESSLDPRKLVAAVVGAVRATNITLREGTAVQSYTAGREGVEVVTSHGTLQCGHLLDCTGAWSGTRVHPAKGQMLRLHAPGALAAGELGNVVVRTPDIYLVPRLDSSIVVGATVEDAGFDKTLHAGDAAMLRQRAAAVLPSLQAAPLVEHWAGLRPATTDGLPLLGPAANDEDTGRVFIAAGHFRNGVLLAPATAHVMAHLLLGEPSPVNLDAFHPGRLAGLQAAQGADSGL